MSNTDFLNALGVGASFKTTELVTALVDAERAPQESRINRRLDTSESEISALAETKASLLNLQNAAKTLNDSTDFDSFTTSNSQTTALSIVAGAGASAGNHSVTVSSIAQSQTMNITQSGDSVFTSATQILNSGTSFGLNIQIGGGSGVTHAVTVSTATPQGIVDAVNAAGLGISAQLVDQGTSGTNYVVQLTGESGAAKSFTVGEASTSILATDIPSGFSAADASVSVNGLSFTRATNNITDIIPGVTLNVNSATTGAASISIARDTSFVKSNIEAFVSAYNTTKSKLDELQSRELDGPLAGNIILRSLQRDIRNIFTSESSTPGSTITRLSDIGVEINKTGSFELDATSLDSKLLANYEQIKTVFSADTTNQTEIGVASRGIAGDLSKLIEDFNSNDGYINSKTASLNAAVDGYQEDLIDLATKMDDLKERYERQFLAMQRVVDEMNNTKDNLIASFENLPFTADK